MVFPQNSFRESLAQINERILLRMSGVAIEKGRPSDHPRCKDADMFLLDLQPVEVGVFCAHVIQERPGLDAGSGHALDEFLRLEL